MKRTTILTILGLLLTAAPVFAQQPDRAHSRVPGINLSLWKGVATQHADTTRATVFNLGITSTLGTLSGLGGNLLGAATRADANGVQLAGLTTVTSRTTRGLNAAGLVTIAGHRAQGITAAGLTSIAGTRVQGIAAAGLLAIAGEGVQGATLAGIATVAGQSAQGVALAGLANVAGDRADGIQAAALLNVVGDTLRGVQLGVANVAVHARGVQIGIVNYYQKSLRGIQLGLVNANPSTQVQLMLFGGTATKLNAGVRFKNHLFYTILGAGTHYLDFSDRFSASAFYRAGLELPLYKQLFISGDLGFQHIETFKNKDYGIPARLYALQARASLEYHLNTRLALFLTGGYGGSRHYGRALTYDKGVIAEAGIILLKL